MQSIKLILSLFLLSTRCNLLVVPAYFILVHFTLFYSLAVLLMNLSDAFHATATPVAERAWGESAVVPAKMFPPTQTHLGFRHAFRVLFHGYNEL